MGQSQVADGWAHFDTFPRACQTIFTSITLEGWVDVMYAVQSAFGSPVLVLAYFMFMVVLLGIFVIELTLAVINDEYDNAAEAEEERQKAEEALWAELHGVKASEKTKEEELKKEADSKKAEDPLWEGKETVWPCARPGSTLCQSTGRLIWP